MLQDAAELAGLGLGRMLPEPTAAAFAFGMLQTLDPTKDWGSITGCLYVWCSMYVGSEPPPPWSMDG